MIYTYYYNIKTKARTQNTVLNQITIKKKIKLQLDAYYKPKQRAGILETKDISTVGPRETLTELSFKVLLHSITPCQLPC